MSRLNYTFPYHSRLIVFLLGVSLVACRPAAAQCYTGTYLGTLPGYTISGDQYFTYFDAGINAYGQVVGYLGNGSGNYKGFVWTPSAPNASTGSLTDLGLAGVWNAYSINASGQVAGISNITNHAIFWTPITPNGTTGTAVQVDFSSGGSQAHGINSYGQVVGYRAIVGVSTAFIFTPSVPNGTTGTTTYLPPQFGYESSLAWSINSSGMVAGSCENPGQPEPIAWIPDSPNATTGTMVDLGSLPGGIGGGRAMSVNDAGQVVGFAGASVGVRAFLWQRDPVTGIGSMYDVSPPGYPNAYAYSINASGQVVGVEYNSVFGPYIPFLWTPTTPNGTTGTWVDLTRVMPSSIPPARAVAINDAGQIVIEGYWLLSASTGPDTTPPATTATVSGPAGSNGWFFGPVQASLQADDPDCPCDVAATYYSLDAGSVLPYNGPIPVNAEGVHQLKYWSVDKAGNIEATNVLTINIDETPPAVSAVANPSVIKKTKNPVPVTVSGNVSDSGSGVDLGGGTYAVTDSYGLYQPSGPITINPNGSYTISLSLPATITKNTPHSYTIIVSGKDIAGNSANAQTVVTVH